MFSIFSLHLSINKNLHQYRQDFYYGLHTYRPRYCQQRDVKAKIHWEHNRQAAFHRKRQKRQEQLKKKRILREAQLAGPGVISSCGVHPTLACNIIDDSVLQPVVSSENGAPITLGQGISGKVDLLRHVKTGYLMASKTIFAATSEM